MAQTLIPSRSPGDSDWLPPSSQALPKESEFEDSPSQSEDYVVDDTKEEDLYRWSQTAPEGQKLEDVNSPTKKPALRKPSPSGFYITTRLRPYSENTEPSTLKQLNHYVRKHEFFTKLSLARFTTSHRRKFERDIYDFGRSLGLSKSKVEEELVKARSFCGEEFYDSDHSAWADEIDDSSTVLKRLSCPSKSTSPNNGVVQSAEAKDLTQSTTSNKSRNLCQLSTAGRNDRSQEQQNTINKKQKNPGEKTHISVPPVAKGASIEVIKRKKRKSFEADMANDKIKDYPAKKRQQKGVQYAQGYRDEQVVPYVKPPGLVQSTNKPTLTSNGLNSNDKVAFAGIVIAKIPTHQIRSLDVVDELLNIDSALLDEPLVSSQSPALAAQPCEREEEKISADVKKISPEFNSRVKRRNRKQVKTLKGTKTSQKPKEQEVNPKEDHSITSLILPASEIPKISGPKVRSHEGLHIYGNQGQDPTSQKPSGVVWTSQEHRNLYSELEWKKGTLKVSLSNEVVGVGGATPDRNLAKDRSVWGENIVKLGCSKDSNQEQLPASQNGSAITGRGKREKRNPKKGTEVEGGNNRKGKTKKAKATHSGLPEISIQNKENRTASESQNSAENFAQRLDFQSPMI